MDVRVIFAVMTSVGIAVAALVTLWAGARLLRLGESENIEPER